MCNAISPAHANFRMKTCLKFHGHFEHTFCFLNVRNNNITFYVTWGTSADDGTAAASFNQSC